MFYGDKVMKVSDSSQQMNIVASPVVPLSCCLFTRHEPAAASNSGFAVSRYNLHRFYMLWYCVKGRGCIAIGNVPYILNAGEAIFIMPGQPHLRLALKNEKVEYQIVRFLLASEPEWLTLLQNQPFAFSEKEKFLLKNLQNSYSDHRKNGESDESAGECILNLAQLLNSVRFKTPASTHPAEDIAPAVKKLCKLLTSTQGGSQNLSGVAKANGISVGHLRMLFKQATGRPPSEVRRSVRMRTAEHLLTHSELNISEISSRLGFGSIYAFSRFFKNNKGMSPLKFRKNYSLENKIQND